MGTTFVAAAVAHASQVEMFTLGDRSVVSPAAVYAREDGELVTGDAAVRRAVSNPDRVCREFKRRLGDPTPVILSGSAYPVSMLLGAVLRDVVARVTDTEGEPPERLVLTHPANWGPYRRELFDEVPEAAGLTDGRIAVQRAVTEPEAAAAHYAASRRLGEGDTVAVYDLGGGTFDATVLRKQADGIEILGTPEGIERLGGVDFDEAILSYVNYQAGGALTELDLGDLQTSVAMARLRQDCVLAKEALSIDTETTIPVFLPQRHFDVRLTLTEFENMIRAQIESTIGALTRTLQSARVTPDDLSAVLLVGGSSRIPLVARMLSEELGRPIVVDTHPKYAVALGAAELARGEAGTAPAAAGAPATNGHAAGTGLPRPAEPAPAAGGLPRPPGKAPAAGVLPRPPGTAEPAAAAGALPRPGGAAGAGGLPRPPASAGPPRPPAAVGAGSAVPDGGGADPEATRALAAHGPAASAAPPGTDAPPGSATSSRGAGSSGGPGPGMPAWAAPGAAGSGTSGPAAPGSGAPGRPSWAAGPANAGRGGTGTAEPPAAPGGTGGPGGAGNAPPPGGIGAGTPPPSPDGGRRSRSRLLAVAVVAVLALAAGAVYLGTGGYGLLLGDSSAQTGQPEQPGGSGSSEESGGSPEAPPTEQEIAVAVPIPTLGEVIPAGPTSGFAAVSPNGRLVYVANRAAGVVTVIDTSVNKITATIAVPAGPPQYVAFAPDGRHVYVSVFNEARTIAAVAVLDTTTNSVVATVPVQTRPFALAVTPDGSKVYVPNHDSGTVSVIDTSTNQVTSEIRVAPNPHWVAMSPDGSRFYTANHESNLITVLDTANDQVVAQIPVQKSPHSVAVNPSRPLVANVNYDAASVSFSDTGTNEVVATVPVGRNPQAIAWSPDGRFVYTANVTDNTVSVISADTFAVTATLPVGNGPTSVAVLPNGEQAYVTNLKDGTLTMLDIAG
nr:Hsp70 family protein [Pseudonocardia sp. C8]